MNHYFAFPASNALRDGSNVLLDNFERGVKDSQSALFVKVSQMFSDEIVDALLLNIVRGGKGAQSSHKMLETFAGVIKNIVHGLIKSVISKMNNDELRPMADTIRSRRLSITRDGVTTDYISFPLPADFYAEMREVMESGVKGVKHPRMLDAMLRFSDMSHTAFFEDSVRPLKLGFIGRNMVAVGGSAIHKGSMSTTRSLVPTLEGDELKDFCAYFLAFLHEV